MSKRSWCLLLVSGGYKSIFLCFSSFVRELQGSELQTGFDLHSSWVVECMYWHWRRTESPAEVLLQLSSLWRLGVTSCLHRRAASAASVPHLCLQKKKGMMWRNGVFWLAFIDTWRCLRRLLDSLHRSSAIRQGERWLKNTMASCVDTL